MTENDLPSIIIPAKDLPQADKAREPVKRSENLSLWCKRLSGFALLLALIVVVLGAWVRLTDAGLGCPDWPGCYGQLDVPRTADEIAAANEAFPDLQIEPQKAWNEMFHRYLASTLGLLILILTLIAFKLKQNRLLSLFLLGMVIFQGLLGMWTVTLLLKPVIVMGHLLGGLTVTSLLFWLYLRQSAPLVQPGINRVSLLALVTLVILLGQIALGGWTSTNYAATACPDFPTCQNQLWPENMDFAEGFVMWRGLGVNYEGGVLDNPARVAIHFTHRLWAIITTVFIIFLGIVALKTSRLKRFGNIGVRLRNSALTMKLLLLIQLGVAVAMITSGFPLGISTAHNAFAALLLLSTVSVVYFSSEND